jgi:predicted nucleotidyltransferase
VLAVKKSDTRTNGNVNVGSAVEDPGAPGPFVPPASSRHVRHADRGTNAPEPTHEKDTRLTEGGFDLLRSPVTLTKWQQRHWPAVERELERIVQALQPLAPERVILFGSHARGDFHEGSDIDLVIIWETGERFLDRIDRVFERISPCTMPVEVLVYSPAEYEQMKQRGSVLAECVEQEGHVLYERPS